MLDIEKGVMWMRFASDRLWMAVLVAIVGCAAPEASEPNPEILVVSSADSPLASNLPQNLPERKTETIFVEGEPQEITLNLYREDPIPVVTYYPDNLSVNSACSQEGCGVFFEWLEAQVHVFVPPAGTTFEELEMGVTGDRGLLASNGWQQREFNNSPSYPWETKNIQFYDSENNLLGSVHLGQSEGQVFRVTVVFPGDMGDGFAPRADMILKNLQVGAM